MLPYMNVPFAWLADQIGASVDELKLLFLFLLSYPLAGILKRIPDRNPWQKNLFIISMGLFYLIGVFDLWDGLWTIFVSSSMAYLISAYIQDPKMPWIGFAALMGHMSISHIQRQRLNNPGIIDITGTQMVLVMKLTAFCWNVHDGRKQDKDLSEFQRERAVKKMPNLLDFAGYVLFFPGLMAGPAFDYVEYAKYISTSLFDLPPGVDPSKAPPRRKKRRIPRSATPAMVKASIGLFWVLVYLKLSGTYTSEFMLSDEFLKYGFLQRVFFLHAFSFTMRTKFYGVWALTEGSCILSGIGYAGVDPKTGRASWDRLVNIKPLELELAQNTRGYIAAWNINTNNWLRNYVYLRVSPPGKKPGFLASMATFVTSAMWHGFHPGYYLTFVMAGFLQNVARHGRRYLRPLFLTPEGQPTPQKVYYDAFTCVVTQLVFSFTSVPFIVLTVRDTLTIWSRVYMFGVLGVAASYAAFSTPAVRNLLARRLPAPPAKDAAAAAKAEKPDADGEAPKRPAIARAKSSTADEIMFGVPVNAEHELLELRDFMADVRAEIVRRKEAGLAIPDVREMVRQKLVEAGVQVSAAAEKEEQPAEAGRQH